MDTINTFRLTLQATSLVPRGQRSSLTQEVFVGAQVGRVPEELDEDVGGKDQNQRHAQQSGDNAVEEQPAGQGDT